MRVSYLFEVGNLRFPIIFVILKAISFFENVPQRDQ